MQNKLNIFSPWTVNVLHWGLIVLLLQTLPTTLWPLTERFWISLCLWIFFFSISSFGTYCCRRNGSSIVCEDIEINHTVYNILLCISIVLTPLYLLKIWQLILDYGIDNFMATARSVALDTDNHIGAVAYCVIINQVLFVATVFAGKNLSWWKHLLVTVLYLLCGIAIMEKGVFIFMAIIAIMVYYERNILKLRHIVVIGIALIISAFAFTIYRSDQSESIKEQSAFNEFVEIYLLASPVAYCYMPEEQSHQWGVNTFSQIYYILNKFSTVKLEEKDKLQEFIDVPVPTNTYTVFQPFYLDFGQWGIAVFAIIYGILLGVIYSLHRSKVPFASLFYGYLIAMLCLQFHQEEIFTSLVRTLQFIFFAFLLSWRPKKQIVTND